MVMDAVRGYVQLANGLTEVTRQRAQQAAKALLQQTGADALTTKVSDLADEIVATSKSNRQLLQAIVANEVEGAVVRLGFVRAEEVAALTRRVSSLEKELAGVKAAQSSAGQSSASQTSASQASAGRSPAAPGARPAADPGPAGDALGEAFSAPAPAKKAGAKKAAKKTAAKTAAKKATPVKKAAVKTAPAKKTAKKA